MTLRETAYQQSMRFTKAEYYTFHPILLPTPFHDSTGGPFRTVPMTNWLVLYDQDGVAGNCPCSGDMGNIILPMIMTGETKTYLEWYDIIYWEIRNRGFATEAAVELGRLDFALHDIMAKRAGLPLHRFLGAERDWVEVYASGCGTSLTRDQMVAEVEQFIRSGYKTFKMKIAANFGTQLDDDIERVRIVRGLIGSQARLAVDANQLWNAQQALAFAEKIHKYEIAWFEEPVHSYDTRELEKLTAVCPIPVAMGESMRNKYQYYPYIKFGVRQLQPIPSNLSGVRDWLFVRDQAREFGLELTSGGFSHITASFIATGNEEDMVEYLYPVLNRFYEMMDLRPEEQDGRFLLPDQPGLPVSPNFPLLEKLNYIAQKQYILPN